MNCSLKKPLFFLLIFCFVMQSKMFAQNFENAGEYLTASWKDEPTVELADSEFNYPAPEVSEKGEPF